MNDNLKKILIAVAAAIGIFIAYNAITKEEKTEAVVEATAEKDAPKQAEESQKLPEQTVVKIEGQEKATEEKKAH